MNTVDIGKCQLNLSKHFFLSADFGVVDEGTSLRMGREIASGGISQTFDDGGLTGTILTDDECQRFVEGDGFTFRVIERTNSLNRELG